jgi:hypothetical protein
MTHKPPVPEASTPPWPAHPAPIDHSAKPAPAETAEETGSEGNSRIAKGVAVAAGVAVGSAALAAALLFAGRNSKPKSAANPPPPDPTKPRPNAGDIGID